MKKILLLLVMVLALAGGSGVMAQDRTVSGVVTSAEDGLPLPGVNVVIKGTTVGTSSDADGKYSVNLPGQEAVLVFSFIGLTTVEMNAVGGTQLDVQMETDVAQLSEVVVVAYGEQTQRAIVGSVASIDSDVIGKQQIASVANAIQGTVPGVHIISSGGQPGDNPVIRVRGIGSINASAEPLIVVNGVPFNGNLNTISADQIETINVLKDASSTALYGSRGANGVILITTKKGKFNTPTTFNFNTSMGVASQAVDMHEFLDSDSYMELSWEAVRNTYQYVDGDNAADAAQFATEDLIGNFLSYNPYGVDNPVGPDGKLVTRNKLWDTDWKSHIQNKSAARRDYAFNVSGGTEKMTYFLSANYLTQEGSIQTSNFKRFTTRMNIDARVNDWFSLGLNTAYSTQDQNYPEQSGSSYFSAIQWLYTVPSIYPLHLRDEDGNIVLDGLGNPIYDYGNTVGQLLNGTRPPLPGENAVGALYNYSIRNKRDNSTATAYAQVDFTDYLSFRTSIGYEKYLFDGFEYAHNQYGYAANVNGRVTQDRDMFTTLNIINALQFEKGFGDHHLHVQVIQESYQAELNALDAQGTGFLPNVQVLNGSTTPESVGGYVTKDRLSSYLGRASYSFMDKYYLEASYRTDGSTRFGQDVRWGNFYSVGAAWVISDESFLDAVGALSFMKLKASFGEVGNNRTANPLGVTVDDIGYFPYLQLFETGWNQGAFTGVLLGDVSDPNLTWEKTQSINVGLEMRFLNDRFGANVEYYDRESIDLIYDKPLAPSTGNTSITTNVGAVRNYGLEVTLTSTNIRNANVLWTTALNFSRDKNKITELTQKSFINGTKRWEEGRSLYEFYIQDWAGVDPDTGYGLWYRDVLDDDGNPTGERETTQTYSQATRYYVDKSSLPDFIGGLSNYVRYRNFDLNLLFNFSVGSYIYDSQYARLMGGFETPGDGAGSPDLKNRWQQPGDVTDVPLLLASNNDFNSTSTRFLFKNDYLRLRALNFGYNLPRSLTERFDIDRVRVYFQGDNLLTFHSHKGLDPEQSLAGTTDNRSYNQKIVSLGLNLTF